MFCGPCPWRAFCEPIGSSPGGTESPPAHAVNICWVVPVIDTDSLLLFFCWWGAGGGCVSEALPMHKSHTHDQGQTELRISAASRSGWFANLLSSKPSSKRNSMTHQPYCHSDIFKLYDWAASKELNVIPP